MVDAGTVVVDQAEFGKVVFIHGAAGVVVEALVAL